MNCNSCRLCGTVYVEKTQSKYNQFSSKASDPSVILNDRLKRLDVFVDKEPGLSNTICRPCWRDIDK